MIEMLQVFRNFAACEVEHKFECEIPRDGTSTAAPALELDAGP